MEQIRNLLRTSPEPFRRHLATLLENILQHPSELKFRKVRESNATLAREFFSFAHARDTLDLLSFDQTGKGETTAWVFMADPGDADAFNVLEGCLRVLKSIENEPLTAEQQQQQQQPPQQQEEGEMDPAAINAVVEQVKRMQRERSADGDEPTPQPSPQQPQPPAPRFFNFASSTGFQMRLDELQQHLDKKDEADLTSFLVTLLLDPANDNVEETLRILKTLVGNLVNNPAEAKYRLLPFENKTLSRLFFPVKGAPELFIGVLGFSVADEGLAKAIDTIADNQIEAKQVACAMNVLAKVEEGLKARADLENEERRRLFMQEHGRAERDAERRAMGLKKAAEAAKPQEDADKPKRKIPIAQALQYLMGKSLDDDE